MNSAEIKQRILQALPEAEVMVTSDDNVHFVARIVSAAFSGHSRIARHRLVHEALGSELGREIHALSLELKSPDEVDG
jgi:stress-induced morphogen